MSTHRSGRALLVACLGLAVAAALLWGGSVTVWSEGGGGRQTGGQLHPWLTGVALLALAGVAGVVATGGVVRRLVGALLALVGVGTAVAGAAGLAGATAGPLLVVGAAAALLAVGVFVLAREPVLARLGTRYAASGDRRPEQDPDRAAWDAMDEGRDPTSGPSQAGTDPGESGRFRPG
jgi:Tryptophan-associated transmembrane protein (Trp_oprn_chp)